VQEKIEELISKEENREHFKPEWFRLNPLNCKKSFK
jgi:hypothetical protein